MANYKLMQADALVAMKEIPDGSIDAVVTDPPYPEIDRPYGKLSEPKWHTLMDATLSEAKRILKPSGSAVFILQANSRKVGEMRLWLWEWLVRAAKSWNLIQDAYWWNFSAPPTVHAQRTRGLMRPSVKMCCWFGSPDCYRNQDEVLWRMSDALRAEDVGDRALQRLPSGQTMRRGRVKATAEERGGVTPFNLIPVANADSSGSSGARGHGAGTPGKLCSWWVRYICPPGGTVLDPFSGAASVGEAALTTGRSYIGIEKESTYCALAETRLADKLKLSGTQHEHSRKEHPYDNCP